MTRLGWIGDKLQARQCARFSVQVDLANLGTTFIKDIDPTKMAHGNWVYVLKETWND